MATRRQKAKIKRAVVLALTVIVSIGIAVGAIFGINALINYGDSGDDNATSKVQGNKEDEKDKGGNVADNKGDKNGDKKPTDDYDPDNKEIITDKNGVQLDANFRRVLLVNGDNPLPDDYDSNIRNVVIPANGMLCLGSVLVDLHCPAVGSIHCNHYLFLGVVPTKVKIRLSVKLWNLQRSSVSCIEGYNLRIFGSSEPTDIYPLFNIFHRNHNGSAVGSI